MFPFPDGLIQEKALLPLFSNFTSDYVIRKGHGNKEGMGLTRVQRPPGYADDHLLEENTNTIKRITALSDTGNKIDLQVRSQHREAHVPPTECVTNSRPKNT
jgi:hypothetical protein